MAKKAYQKMEEMKRRAQFIKIFAVLVVVLASVVVVIVAGCSKTTENVYLVNEAEKVKTINVGGFDYHMYEYLDKDGTYVFFVRLRDLDGVVFIPNK